MSKHVSTEFCAQVKPELEEAGIPLPPPEVPIHLRTSYTIYPESGSSIGVLFKVDQLYVNRVMNLPLAASRAGPGVNSKGGVTISIRKCGGWKDSYSLAVALANPPTGAE